jgi:uncharacterized protein YjbJ (UPF0337 family)
MLNNDEIKGKTRQVIGTIKENLGWLSDDHKAEREGKDERVEGKIQEHDSKCPGGGGKRQLLRRTSE